MTTSTDHELAPSALALRDVVARQVAGGRRLADLFGTARGGDLLLTAQVAGPGAMTTLEAVLSTGEASYPAFTPLVSAAFWYERELHDLFGVVPAGHPRLEPLVLPADPREIGRAHV